MSYGTFLQGNFGISYTEAIDPETSQQDASDSDEKEKEPLSFKTTQLSQPTIQSFVPFLGIQLAIIPQVIELNLPPKWKYFYTFRHFFSTTDFFRTLFRCYISTNAP